MDWRLQRQYLPHVFSNKPYQVNINLLQYSF